ncbi:MAG: hypothetical protein ACYDDV_11150 [Methanoregula sp.]
MICSECGTRLPKGMTKCHFCGNSLSVTNETSFIDKFVALFTLLAVFIAIIVFFYSYTEGISSDVTLRAVTSIVVGAVLTCFYWLMSPLMIKTLIDPLKPINVNVRKLFGLIGFYFVTVGANFLFFQSLFSLGIFVLLTVLFILIYIHFSHQ